MAARNSYLYIFRVSGYPAFPLDMLRYDRCWPHSSEDVSNIRLSGKTLRTDTEEDVVTLASYQEPTPARWRSFGWQFVGLIEKRKAS